jgi:hypothetical protein
MVARITSWSFAAVSAQYAGDGAASDLLTFFSGVNRARERLVRQSKQCGVKLRQSYISRRCRSVPIGLNRRSSRATNLVCRADSPHER